MKENEIRSRLGEILCYDKYKFTPNGLISNVVRDFLEVKL